jgi:BirA family biotin operon repressor/biotin-[acetyl-CoA-carboxylase] ligase
MNPFNLAQVESLIAGTPFSGQIHHLSTTHSTNDLALEAARQGVATGVWVADEQTAGRGRGGHAWHSAPFVDGHPAGLYVSVLVRPQLFGSDALKLSLSAGLAAATAVDLAVSERIDLRWPNDLMLTGPDGIQKKFGGILTESSLEGGPAGALAHAVIGIGMNLNHTVFPTELAPLATSLRIVLGSPVSREAILADLLNDLAAQIDLLEAELRGALPANKSKLIDRFGAASSWVHDLRVHVDEDGGYMGVTAGLTLQGLLQVRLDDGTTRVVRHGGVRRT